MRIKETLKGLVGAYRMQADRWSWKALAEDDTGALYQNVVLTGMVIPDLNRLIENIEKEETNEEKTNQEEAERAD